jgi:hypothetical protein
MPARGRAWSDDERTVVLAFYIRTPFSRIDTRHPEVALIAQKLMRTPSSVAMKALNFASLDPQLRASGRTGLAGASEADRRFWERSAHAWTDTAVRAGELERQMEIGPRDDEVWSSAETERWSTQRQRTAQSFFRRAVLTAYGGSCAISGLSVTSLLTASHIIPWSVGESRRADPCNGIALNALYDRAFDRGLISFDIRLKVLLSPRLREIGQGEFFEQAFLGVEAVQLRMPDRFAPDPLALEYHRDAVFQR